VRLSEYIQKRLRDSDGTAIGDVNAAIAVNVGEPGGSETHVSSHSRVVQRTGSARSDTTAGESETRPAASTERPQGEAMTDETRSEELEALTPEELEAQGGEELPDREAMSLLNANIAAPVNAAAALNVLSDNSNATATATQTADIDQAN
jgi:hypothetical protein